MSESETSWIKETPESVKKKIIELAKKDLPAEKIGLVLRDEHGIPHVKLFGLKIKKVLKEEGLYVDSHLQNIERKIEKLNKHLKKNKHDYTSQQSISKNTGRVNKIKKLAKN